MCKFLKIFSVIAAVLALFSVAIPSEAAKKNVAVMTIDNNSDTVQTSSESILYRLVAENMASQLVSKFHSSDDYAVIDTEKVSKELSGIGGAIGQDQAVKIGKKVNAQRSVIGKVVSAEVVENRSKKVLEAINKITGQKSDDGKSSENPEDNESNEDNKNVSSGDFDGKIVVELKFLNNDTGEVIYSDEIKITQAGNNGANALRTACKVAAEEFVTQAAKKDTAKAETDVKTDTETEEPTPTEANSQSDISVIYVEGNELYINKGKTAGIKVGDIFIISTKGVPIKDMDGTVITVKTTEVGKAMVTEVNKDHSICKIIERKDSENNSIKRGCTAQKTDE